jgi:murein DD-endopeptidase MepM/ murein hydrolase activator NlpD
VLPGAIARETASAARPKPRPQHTARREYLSVLIVRADGARVIRFKFACPTPLDIGIVLTLIVALMGVLVADGPHVPRLYESTASLQQELAEQAQTIDSYKARVAELRKETARWRELHARIWAPFGPELAPGGKERGIGGGTPVKELSLAAASPADQLQGLTDEVKEQTQQLTALERLMARAGTAVAALPSRWPVRGAVNSEFGKRKSPWGSEIEFHSGLDIRADRGTPIYAPASGIVVLAGSHQDYGTAIILDHGQDVRSLYGHLSRLNVQPAQRVERGGIIGWTGNTGRSSGPHLHYEISVRGEAVNPRAYLWN